MRRFATPGDWPQGNLLITGLMLPLLLAITTSACNLLSRRGIPDAIAAGCPAIGGNNTLYPAEDVSFGDMLDAMAHNHTSIRWQATDGGGGIVRTLRHDPLTNADVALDMEVAPRPGETDTGWQVCRNAETLVTGMTVNGDRLDGREAMQVLSMLTQPIAAARRKAAYVPTGLPKPSSSYAPPGATFPQSLARSPPQGLSSSNGVDGPAATPSSPPPAEMAARAVIVADQGLWCCLTVGQIADAFRTGGGASSLGASEPGAITLDVTDPNGRWKGWHAFRLTLEPTTAGDNSPVRPSTVKVDGNIVMSDDPQAGGPIGRLIRQSFHLIPPSWPKADLGGTYNACLGALPASQGEQAERQQCIEAEYQRRDQQLNAAYRARMASLAPDGKLVLRAAERAWLSGMQRQCGILPQDDPRDRFNATYCLAAMTMQRTLEIEQHRESIGRNDPLGRAR